MNSALAIILLVAVVGFAECKPYLKDTLEAELSQARDKRGMYSGALYGLVGYMEFLVMIEHCELAWQTSDVLNNNDYREFCSFAFGFSDDLHNGKHDEQYLVDFLSSISPLIQCINIRMGLDIVKFSTEALDEQMYVAYTSQAETMTHMCEIVYGSFEKEEQEFEYDMQEAENGGGGANGEGNAEGEANGQGTTTTQETSTNGTSYDAEERAFLLHLRRLLKGVSKKN